MDFFGHQERARTRTGWLVALFFLAVFLIAASVYLAILPLYLHFFQSQWLVNQPGWAVSEASVSGFNGRNLEGGYIIHPFLRGSWGVIWNPRLFVVVFLVSSLVIFIGSFYKYWVLVRGGGEGVTSYFPGRYVSAQSASLKEKQLMNVVEEMAVASGVVMPRVYLVSSASINAFAAGISPNLAILGVTEGALEHLTRDELQGVVAHEFSHIVNGDMDLNIRLAGYLHGIFLIGLLGRFILRATRRGNGKGKAAVLGVGLLLSLVGYVGILVARAIQAAVSREREYLADAAAVQFTRNPAGLCGALVKIMKRGADISGESSEEFSHLFFQSVSSARWFSSHPPLGERINRLDPSFSAQKFSSSGQVPPNVSEDGLGDDSRISKFSEDSAQELVDGGPFAAAAGVPTSEPLRNPPLIGVARRGLIDLESVVPSECLELGRQWSERLTPKVRGLVETPQGALAVLFLLCGLPRKAMESDLDPEVLERVEEVRYQVSSLPLRDLFPLLDLCLGVVRGLGLLKLVRLRDVVELYRGSLGEASSEVIFLRYVVGVFLRARVLDLQCVDPLRLQKGVAAMRVRVVLSSLVHWGTESFFGQEASVCLSRGLAFYERGLEGISEPMRSTLREFGILKSFECRVESFDRALFDCRGLSFSERVEVFKACLTIISADGRWDFPEEGLALAIAAVLDLPMPFGGLNSSAVSRFSTPRFGILSF